MRKRRVAVLISGAGSNMAALIDAGLAPDTAFEVVLAVSNIANAGGLAVAGVLGLVFTGCSMAWRGGGTAARPGRPGR